MWTLFPVFIFVVALFCGMQAYVLRYEENSLVYCGRTRFYISERHYDFTPERKRTFYWMFLLHCFSVPFYIPCIFFDLGYANVVWSFGIFLVTKIIFIIYDWIKDSKEEKQRRKKLEDELREQKSREALGRFK